MANPSTLIPTNSSSTTQSPTTDLSLASCVILTVLSGVLFSAVSAVLFLYYWKRLGKALVETRIGIVIFFLGALLTTITTLACYKDDEHIYSVYRILLEICLGIVLVLAGVVLLFEQQSPDRESDDYGQPLIPVGETHGSMGIVIWMVTIPLSALEMFFAIGAATKSPAPMYAAVMFVSFIQKLVQASIYHFSLRHKVPRSGMQMGCSWFLKTISLFNFAFWVDSITTTHDDDAFVIALFGNGFSIVKSAYNALVIDYRLLCSLLFLEHAFELEKRHSISETPSETPDEPFPEQMETVNTTVNVEPQTRQSRNRTSHEASESRTEQRETVSTSVNVEVVHYSGYGYTIGLICVGLQLVSGSQYLDFVGDWSNIFPIMSDFMVVSIGLMLLSNTPVESNHSTWRETESKAIDVMVGFMGAVGFVFWVMQSSFCFLWTFSDPFSKPDERATKSYFLWTAVKTLVRAIGILFQLHFFVKMGPNYCTQPSTRRMRHLLVPAIMLCVLAVFTTCVIDQYNGRVEHLIHQSQLDPIITSFFNAAAPIHLGFSLHMFLHFYIIKRKMSSSLGNVYSRRETHFSQVPESRDMDEREPLTISNPNPNA